MISEFGPITFNGEAADPPNWPAGLMDKPQFPLIDKAAPILQRSDIQAFPPRNTRAFGISLGV